MSKILAPLSETVTRLVNEVCATLEIEPTEISEIIITPQSIRIQRQEHWNYIKDYEVVE